jgi:hypothetical protein
MATSASNKSLYGVAPASIVPIDTTNFTAIPTTENTVQEAIDYIDDLVVTTPTNPVPNPSFEIGTTTNATDWTEGTGFERSNEQAYLGSWSMKITATGTVYACPSTAFTVTPNTRYILRAWVYVSSYTSGSLAIDMNDVSDEITLQASLSSKPIGQWVEITSIWDSRQRTSVQLRLVTASTPTFTCYVDYISLMPTLFQPIVNQLHDFNLIQPDQMEFPVAGWAVNVVAQVTTDSNNSSETIARFDTTTEEGLGFTLKPPVGAVGIVFRLTSRPEVTPASTLTAIPKIYFMQKASNGTWSSWSAGAVFATLSFTNANGENWQYSTQTFYFTGAVSYVNTPDVELAITTGLETKFEITETGGTMINDWTLSLIEYYYI